MRESAGLLVLFLSACGNQSTPLPDGCARAGTCPADMAMPPPPPSDMTGMTCSPACAAPTPYCNDALVCVPCLVDGHCPAGFVCQKRGDSTDCVPGCADDSRCRPDGGGSMACCGNRCVDITTDPANCGGCGKVCTGIHSEAACADSQCQTGECDPGWGDCNRDPADGCETNVHVDPAHCVACGMACSIPNAFAGCADGCYLAACNFGWADCNGDPGDGCEQDVMSDMKNCGGCGSPCMNRSHAKNSCIAASCVITACDLGYSDCDTDPSNGCEIAIGTDVKNCGRCGNACPQGLICVNGGCTCPQCNIPNAKSKCVNNQCTFDSCLPGHADCNNNVADGCEVDVNTDAKNCGGCQKVCPQGQTCANGSCSNAAIVCGTADEGSDATITCPQGMKVVSIDFASYGTPTGACGNFAQSNCHAPNSVMIVQGYCVGKNTCTVPASNDTFGDPCYGTVKNLDIQARCG